MKKIREEEKEKLKSSFFRSIRSPWRRWMQIRESVRCEGRSWGWCCRSRRTGQSTPWCPSPLPLEGDLQQIACGHPHWNRRDQFLQFSVWMKIKQIGCCRPVVVNNVKSSCLNCIVINYLTAGTVEAWVSSSPATVSSSSCFGTSSSAIFSYLVGSCCDKSKSLRMNDGNNFWSKGQIMLRVTVTVGLLSQILPLLIQIILWGSSDFTQGQCYCWLSASDEKLLKKACDEKSASESPISLTIAACGCLRLSQP